MTIDIEQKPFGSYRHRLLSFIYSNAYNKKLPGELRKFIKEKMPVQICIDKECDGVRMRLIPSQNFHDMLFASNHLFTFEADTFNFINDVLNNEDVFIDIGANTGAICIPVAMWNSTVRCLAIEANPDIFQRLLFNVGVNNLTNMSCVNLAVDEKSGTADLYISSKRNFGSGSLLQKNDGTKYKIDKKPLDEILIIHNINKTFVVKIDIEGYEGRALMPFFRSKPNVLWPKAVIIEHKNKLQWKENCLDFMLSHGYKLYGENNIDTMLTFHY